MNLVWGAVALFLVVGIALWWFYPIILARASFTLLTSADPKVRIEAIDPLARLAYRGYPGAFEALDRATEDPDETVRATASRCVRDLGQALGRLPLTEVSSQQELDQLKSLLLGENSTAGTEAAEKLRKRGDPWLYQAGVQIRADERLETVLHRLRVVRALGLLRDRLAASYLLLALSDTDPVIRHEAGVAAGAIGPSRCQPVLETLASLDSHPQVRAAAQQALTTLKR
jgi:HEAT repeat protein